MDIITSPQKIGDVAYLPADMVDVEDLLKRQMLNERLVRLMREQDKIGKVTPETFKIAVARRPAGSPWPPRGFTEAYLLESGLIEPEAAPEPPAPRKAVKDKPPGQPRTVITHVERTADAVQVGEYFLQPKKRGNFVFYDAIKADGSLLRDKGFKSIEAGSAFLSTVKPEADNHQGDQSLEKPDGDHVQSSAAVGDG